MARCGGQPRLAGRCARDPWWRILDIAALVSETTIKTHLLHIYTKLGVRDRASAVATAYERGLLG